MSDRYWIVRPLLDTIPENLVLDLCRDCGVLVGDTDVHDNAHDELARLVGRINEIGRVAAEADRTAGMLRPLGGAR